MKGLGWVLTEKLNSDSEPRRHALVDECVSARDDELPGGFVTHLGQICERVRQKSR